MTHQASRRDERFGTVVAVGLAMVGLIGALLAWRLVDVGSDVGDASHRALAAARERSGAVLGAEARVSQTYGAWLAYELERRRAAELRAGGHLSQAAREDKAAAAHWGFVDPEYLDLGGVYLPEAHVEGIVSSRATQVDLDAAPHLVAAERAEARAGGLSLVGIVIAGALPLLTLAEVGRGRLRWAAGVAGAGQLAGGMIALVMGWG
jgi:hypothetical protein